MTINPSALGAIVWVGLFLWMLISRGPPKGPSAQEVQLAFPFMHQEAPAQ